MPPFCEEHQMYYVYCPTSFGGGHCPECQKRKTTEATLDRLVAEHEAIEKFPRAVELLNEGQWFQRHNDDGQIWHECPWCHGIDEDDGHYADCPVANFFKGLGSELDAGRGGE